MTYLSREHFLVECSRLQKVSHRYRSQLSELLFNDNSETFVQSYISQLLLESTQCGANGGLVLTEETVYNLEKKLSSFA